MNTRDNSYPAGFAAAHRPGTTVANVEIPALYTADQVARFLSGFLAGKWEKTTLDQVAARDDEAPDDGESTTTIDAVLTDEQRALPPSRLDVIEGGVIDNDPQHEPV